jgi:tetratricopeptide (TPR) repeat protein
VFRAKFLVVTMVMSASGLGAQVAGRGGPMEASHLPKELVAAQGELLSKHFAQAKEMFAAYLVQHPGNLDAEVGVGDAELGMHEYEAAEMQYRAVVAVQPERWLAHKNLVIIEAALGRWEEFDRERAVLRGARERGAPGISARESDVIDSFDIHGEHWIVREYYEPVGRSLTRYNFEEFAPDGKVKAYVSLESAEAAKAALAGGDVHVGSDAAVAAMRDFALNFYTGKAHGTIARYPGGEPRYERVRRDVMVWVRARKAE